MIQREREKKPKKETEGERKEKESSNQRYKEGEGKKGHPLYQQLPPKLKAMVIKSYVAIREVKCPPSSLKER